jgi:hypothetical protein
MIASPDIWNDGLSPSFPSGPSGSVASRWLLG